MKSKALAVYLVETGQTERTDKVDILTPRDDLGDEMIVSVAADTVVISKLSSSNVKEVLKITLADLV